MRIRPPAISLRVAAVLVATLAACAQTPPTTLSGTVEAPSRPEYARLVERHTRKTNQYAGFYQTFQADVTLLTSEMRAASLRQRAHLLQWDQRKYAEERDRVMQEASAYTKAFIRFFAPDRDHDDLAKPKSIWKIYLDFNGSRLEGKARKMDEKLVEIQALYPHFDRFSTAYEVTFNIPVATVEAGSAKIVLTSSLGTAEFDFPPLK